MLNSIKKVYALLPKSDKFKFLILFFLMIIASLVELLGVGIIPAFIITIADSDLVFETPYIGNLLLSLGIDTRESLITFSAILLVTIYLLKNVFLVCFQYFKVKFIKGRLVLLQNRLFKAYLTAPYEYYIRQNSSVLLRNVTGEVNKIITGTLLPLIDVTLKLMMATFLIGSLLYLEPFITLITIVVMLGGGMFFLKLTREKITEAGKIDRRARAEKNKVVLQGIGAFKDTRVLGREKMFLDQYDKYAYQSVNANIYKSLVGSLPRPIIEMLLIIGILSITLIMVWEGRPFSVIIPLLTLFGMAGIKLMPIFSSVIKESNSLRYNAASVHVVYEDLKHLEKKFIDYREELLEEPNRLKLNKKIELKNVIFEYPNSEEHAVNGVSLSIPKGSAIAFVGPSGAGKTTIVDIILGLLSPKSGSVEVDGTNIQDNLKGWMMNIGYIPQSIYLLDDRISRNIALGIPDEQIDMEKLEAALEAAQLKEVVEKLPKGLNTKIGERGIRLSGGQQQRIGIARALYNNPQVLIMDEATSALDNITEKVVIEAIERLRGDRTIIMIAHRLTTVQNCDVIYMMQEGRVVGKGNYEELMENSLEFRKMSLVEE
ncbi:MAG: ABC transporter ATP-binding protein [Balneolaceae bacterium]|nr:ABC transporter ATP-binding protein [Balneolaceae bacterium]